MLDEHVFDRAVGALHLNRAGSKHQLRMVVRPGAEDDQELSFGSHATGSDVSVTYSLCDADFARPWLTVHSSSVQAAAWEPGGTRVAYGVVAPPDGSSEIFETCLFVDDVATGALTRSPAGVVSGPEYSMITHVAWSSDGMLVADVRDSGEGMGSECVLVMRGDDLSTAQDLGEGHLSVWVP